MIVDLILDRKDGHRYDVRDFYYDVTAYEEDDGHFPISRALDSGTEKDVKRELCNYILKNGYNEELCDYINSVNWLGEWIW